jgi:hypothetical protein
VNAVELLDVTNEELLAIAQKQDRLLEEFADGLLSEDSVEPFVIWGKSCTAPMPQVPMPQVPLPAHGPRCPRSACKPRSPRLRSTHQNGTARWSRYSRAKLR